MEKLEKDKKLSESMLWTLQEEVYRQFGPRAWTEKGVPFYLTSNPFLARRFALLLLAYFRDCIEKGADPKEPFYLFDLGAGSGRLGYLVLRYLLPLIEGSFQVVYVMTDMVEENLKYWKAHPYLKPLVARGVLDFALYHHEQNNVLHLENRAEELTAEGVKNPIALLCTYYFDTLPQDTFMMKEGQLHEGHVTLSLSEPLMKRDAPSLIKNVEASYAYAPVATSEGRYPGHWGAILQKILSRFDNQYFLFPCGAFASLDFFRKLSADRLLLLAADQAAHLDKPPKVCRHASFSIGVSYEVVENYFSHLGGVGFLTPCLQEEFIVTAAILGADARGFSRTCSTFEQQMVPFEPADYWQLTNLSEAALEVLSLDQLLLLLKLGDWDPVNCHLFFPALLRKVKGATERQRRAVAKAVERIWENFYPVSKWEGDFVLNLGVLLFEVGEVKRAHTFFCRALELGATKELVDKNLALAQRALEESV